MYTIHKITLNPTVDFAADELKKYLRMMMPRCGEVAIDYDAKATGGFRLGLMQDFGLDISDAEKPDLDDIVYVETDAEGGIIAGSNPGALLIAVYRYLRFCGCRWLFPGAEGEWIPVIEGLPAVSYRKKADYRYRGLVTFVSDRWPTEYMHLFTATGWTGETHSCDEGELAWIKKSNLLSLPLWEGDKIFLKLLDTDRPFFSLKLRYEGEHLAMAVLDGQQIV